MTTPESLSGPNEDPVEQDRPTGPSVRRPTNDESPTEPVHPTLSFESSTDSEPVTSEQTTTGDGLERINSTEPQPIFVHQSDEPTDRGTRSTAPGTPSTAPETSTMAPGTSGTAAYPGREFGESSSTTGYSTPVTSPQQTLTAAAPDQPWSTPVAPEQPVGRGVRMRTVVFGLVLLVIAGAVLVGELTDITVDAGAVILALMIGCGLLLLVGARRS
jgi:hypothetical protein